MCAYMEQNPPAPIGLTCRPPLVCVTSNNVIKLLQKTALKEVINIYSNAGKKGKKKKIQTEGSITAGEQSSRNFL